MSSEKKSLQQIIEFRKEKLGELRKNGVNPYPSSFIPEHFSKSIKINFKEFEGHNVIVAGRIMAIRRMGKASFCQIIDKEGGIQIFLKKDDVGNNLYENFKLYDIGDFVGVKGKVLRQRLGKFLFVLLRLFYWQKVFDRFL